LLKIIDITSKGEAIHAQAWRGPGKVSHTHRPPLPPCYSFLLEVVLTSQPWCSRN